MPFNAILYLRTPVVAEGCEWCEVGMAKIIWAVVEVIVIAAVGILVDR